MFTRTLLAVVLCSAALPAMAEIVLPDVPAPAPGAKPAAKPVSPEVKSVDAFGSRLRFAGGDTLRGALVSFDAASGLAWKHKDGLAPFLFRADNLDRVDLSTFAPKKEAVDLRLSLNNGDILLGKLVEFTPASVTLDTWYAGRLVVPTDAVRSLAPIKNSQGFILAGFGKLADWKFQNGGAQQMRIHDGQASLSNGVWAGRELELPAKYKVDLEIVGGAPQFMLAVMADGVQFYGGNCFTVQFNGGNGWVQKCMSKGNNNRTENIGNFRVAPHEGNFVLSLCIDTEARTMTTLVHGKAVHTAAIPADFKPGKHLVLGGQNGTIRFAKLQVEPWSGQVEGMGAAAKRPPHDIMVLANKDQMSGDLLGIKDGKASFKAEFATMEVPLDRIRHFDLSAKNSRVPKNPKDVAKNEVRFFFSEGERLTVALDGIKDGKLTGTSPVFGSCKAELAAFQKAVFNLEAPFRAEAQKMAEDAGEEDQ